MPCASMRHAGTSNQQLSPFETFTPHMNFDSATFSRTTLSTHATRTPPPTQVPATHRPVPDASPACSLQRCSPPHSLTPSPSIPARLAPVRAWHGASESLIVAPADPWSTPVNAAISSARPATTKRVRGCKVWLLFRRCCRWRCSARPAKGATCLCAHKGKRGKPVVLAQAGIRGGEIDGKDAGLVLLRDIANAAKTICWTR